MSYLLQCSIFTHALSTILISQWQHENDLMWQWFQKLRSQMTPVSGPMMQNKTLTISIRFQSIYRLAAQVYAAI